MKRSTIPVTASLVLLPLAYYAANLGASWRYDDAIHLVYVQQFGLWQFFFDPHAVRVFNSAFITPWNPLVYWLNFKLFGFSAYGAYLHQLIVLGVATYLIYRVGVQRWKPLPAFLAALIFACGPPTSAVANELMDNHYAWGGVFALLATWFYFRPATTGIDRPPKAALVCYALACLCKEVYVVLPALLWLAAPGRWRSCAYFALIDLPYLAWRWIVLGQPIAGYPHDPMSMAGFVNSARSLAPLPQGLLSYSIYLIAVLLAVLLIARRLLWRELGIVATQILVVLLPLITIWGSVSGTGRYQFSLWIVLSIWCAGLLDRVSHKQVSVATLFFGSLILLGCWHAGAQYQHKHEVSYARQDAYSRFVSSRPGHVYLLAREPDAYPELFAADALAQAVGLEAADRPETIYDAARLTPAERLKAYDYDPECRCVAPVRQTDRVRDRQPPVDFSTLPLSSRIVRAANAGTGHVDDISLRNATIVIRGWVALPDTMAGRTISVAGEYMPTGTQVATLSRPDVAETEQRPDLEHSGFEVRYRYSSVAAAQASRAGICVFGFAPMQGFILIPGQANRVCEEYLK